VFQQVRHHNDLAETGGLSAKRCSELVTDRIRKLVTCGFTKAWCYLVARACAWLGATQGSA